MKNTTLQIIIILLLLGLIVINAVNLLHKQQNLSIIESIYKENQKQIDTINKEISIINTEIKKSLKQIDSLRQSNDKIIKRYSNERTKLDQLFSSNNDTMLVNAVLRFWADRLYKLPRFFQDTTSNL